MNPPASPCGWIRTVGKRNWIQNKTKSEDWMLYFLCAHRSRASAEYNAWRNCLDRWNSKITTTTTLSVWNVWTLEHLNGCIPTKRKKYKNDLTLYSNTILYTIKPAIFSQVGSEEISETPPKLWPDASGNFSPEFKSCKFKGFTSQTEGGWGATTTIYDQLLCRPSTLVCQCFFAHYA
jgi:hypothetical protein